ncbi:50S ribosomal protein L24 [Nitrosopumilus piranensis]|uniref:Large ribosomal subunit protein uL24 n=1 Tax=Nitrosopumilus piranensis TaxID=1582439 RepID=A0A0C5BWL6_9ARCH|nr:50S ribosomal protein L24 [Nitrosopumilus piranensis]AJM92634.1 50S ribosomal protein L24P [Nitrosopumilus piranensis]
MKPTKMRNKMIYRASYKTKSKQLGSALSKDLHKKYGKRSVRVVEGDSVTILRGEFKGVDGKVSEVSTEKSSVAIEGVKKEKTKGDKFDVFIHTSNLLVTSLNTSDKWRMAKLEGKDPTNLPKETPKAAEETAQDTSKKEESQKTDTKETKVEKESQKKEDEN